MKNITFKLALVLCIGGFFIISSCTKDAENKAGNSQATESTSAKNIRMIKALIKQLPELKLTKDINGHRNGANSILDPGFSFSSPHSGGTVYSSPTGIMYTTRTNSTIFITGGSFGANTSVGTVVAGSSVLDIGFTFCFASDGDPVGLNFFNVNGANFNGVSAVIGVSGDFEAIQNGTVNDTTSFADFFQGLAFYIVYDGEASGKYDVVNWLDIDLNDTAATHGQSFAFALDFKTGHLFLSKSGSVKVTDGSMDFDGEYFDVGGFLNADGDFDLSGSNLTYNTVPGFGAMGCN